MRKWIPAVLLAAVLILSAMWFSELPPTVSPEWGVLIPWAPAGQPVSRGFAAFGIPLIAVATWLLLRGVASPAGERLGRRFFPRWLVSEKTGAQAVERFGPTFDAIVATIVVGLLLLHLVLLGTVLGWPLWTARVFSALVGSGLIALGNILPRTRPNWVAGLRTKATLADPDLWRRTHRWFGGLVMVTGIAVIVVSLRSAPSALLLGVVGVLVSAIVATLIAGRGEGRRPESAPTVLLLILAASAAAVEAQSTAYREEPFNVTSNGLLLPGTLTVPSQAQGAIPVAVMVAGSGPTDRNGNGPAVRTDLYSQLAHALAESGIATLRYDKRGIGEAARTLDHAAMTLDDFVGDVMAAARAVQATRRFSHVFLIGHSEGAGLVLQAANRMPVAGIAMMSGTGRPLRDVLHDQFGLVSDSLTVRRADSAFARFIRGEEVPDAPQVAAPVLVPHYRKMIVSMAQYDPEAEAARLTVPLLVVQGGMDLQVLAVDAERLRAANHRASLLSIPGANHVFKLAASRDPATQGRLYQDPTIPIVRELAPGLSAWIKSLTGG